MTAVPMIIAEVGSVHDGSFGNALKLIDAAAACGVDAVKFQTHIADAETLKDAAMPPYFKGEPRFDYFQRTSFDTDQWRAIKQHCAEKAVEFLSSPFSIEAVSLLEDVGVGAYKIPSGEVTNLPLLECVAETAKPVLLSSGMSSWAELDSAVTALRGGGALTVLQCSSAYPCPPERVGLNVMTEIRDRYGVPVGYSDHTLGSVAAFAAAALGASVIEKHFTFSRLMYGSDAANAMEPEDFRSFVQGLREISTILANPVDKDNIAPYGEMKAVFEKSIVTSRAIAANTVLTLEDLAFKKPGDGIPAARFRDILGKRSKAALPANYKLKENDLA